MHLNRGSVQTIILLIALLALTSWLYLMSNLDYKSQQTRIKIVNELLQETTSLAANVLLIENKGRNDFTVAVATIATIESLLDHKEMSQPITAQLAFEVRRFLTTVTELRFSYVGYRNSLMSFTKSGFALKNKLIKTNSAELMLKLSSLQERVISYVALIQHGQASTLDDISFQLDSFVQVVEVGNLGLKDDALAFSRQAMVLLNHAAMLEEINDTLFQYRILEESRQAITLYEEEFVVAEAAARHVKLSFFISIFILLCLAFVLRLKQRQSFKELKSNTKALGFSLAMANQKQFSVDVQKGLVILGKEYSKALGSGSKEHWMSIVDWKDNIHPDDRAVAIKALELSMCDGEVFEQEYRWKSKNGNWSWLRTTSRVTEHDKQGMPLKMVGVSSNINERKRNEQVLRVIAECHSGGDSSETIFHSIVRELGMAKNVKLTFVATVSQDSKTVNTLAVWKDGQFVSNFSYSLLGTPCEKIVAREACFYPSGLQQLFPDDAQLKELGLESYMGVPLLNKNEGVIGLLVILGDKPMTDKMLTEPLMLSLATRAAMEIERQDADKKLLQLAHYDALTGLPNRSLLSDRFLQAQAHNERSKSLLAVCFLDLDDFKPVNDVYGHGAGDQLLKQVAMRLLDSIRGDDTVSRLGGDEFVLLLGEMATIDECEQSLCRIIENLSLPYNVVGESISISASIGYTLTRTPDDELDVLLRQADHAMYNAKAMGKNSCSLFDMGLDRRKGQRENKLLEIKEALVEGDLCLFYQPKVNMRTGFVYGVEALIRWQHPEDGLLSPAEFLPVLDATDLEISVGHWVVSEALQQMQVWKERGVELQVSVNISSYHLLSKGFVSDLTKLLAKYPMIDPSLLQLEVLESSSLGDIASVGRVLSMCRDDLGLAIALDDFGTGYSSLAHLRNLPADTIKIDRSFIRDILHDVNDYVIVKAVVGLASSFNLEVIAEGVETEEQGLTLLGMGCDCAQGFGISRPMPAIDVEAWLDSYQVNKAWLGTPLIH